MVPSCVCGSGSVRGLTPVGGAGHLVELSEDDLLPLVDMAAFRMFQDPLCCDGMFLRVLSGGSARLTGAVCVSVRMWNLSSVDQRAVDAGRLLRGRPRTQYVARDSVVRLTCWDVTLSCALVSAGRMHQALRTARTDSRGGGPDKKIHHLRWYSHVGSF